MRAEASGRNEPSGVLAEHLPAPAAGTEADSVFRLWSFIGIIVGAYIFVYFNFRIPFEDTSTLSLARVLIMLCCVATICAILRVDDRLVRLFRAVAEILLIGYFVGGLSYAAASLNRPLWDGTFDAWDTALGFHWREWLNLLNEHPGVHFVLLISYRSMIWQVLCVLAALVTVRAYRTLDTFLIAFGTAALVCVVVSAVMPALSPLVYLGIMPSDHPNIVLGVPSEFVNHVQALRAGTMRMIDLSGAQGLVTFPSFHTVCGVLLALAFWRVPYVRWLGLALNGLMLLSVPIEGCHYLVDLIAGVVVAIGAWTFARMMTVGASGHIAGNVRQTPVTSRSTGTAAWLRWRR